MRSRASPRRRRRGATRAGAHAAAGARQWHRMRSRARPRSCAAAAPEPQARRAPHPGRRSPNRPDCRDPRIRSRARRAARWDGAGARAAGAAGADASSRLSSSSSPNGSMLRRHRARVRGAHHVQIRGRVPRIRREIAVELPVALAVVPLGARRDRRHGRGLGDLGSRLVDRRLLGQILGDVRRRIVREREARDLVDRLLRRGRRRHHEERVLAARAAHPRAAGRHARVVELEFGLAALAGNDHATCFGAAGGPLEAEPWRERERPRQPARAPPARDRHGQGRNGQDLRLRGARARRRRARYARVGRGGRSRRAAPGAA